MATARDHVLFALALGTGLREHEALALDVRDIAEDGTTIKRRVTLCVFKALHQAAGAGRYF